MSYIAVVVAELWVLEAVAAHLGVFVVDGVDEEKNDRYGDHGDSHESCYQRQVVLCKYTIQRGNTCLNIHACEQMKPMK